MRVIMQQGDMDTCLTGVILGMSASDQVEVVRGGATREDLTNPVVLCIEAGGSGQIELNNFDHHDSGGPTEPACLQALTRHGASRMAGLGVAGGGKALRRLVEYVATVDTDPTDLPPVEFPTLSAVFSGMRLAVADAVEQFRRGLDILTLVLEEGVDPFGTMPDKPEWHVYVAAKRANEQSLQQVRHQTRIVSARSGRRIGYLETEAIGALGTLYSMGCEIAVVCHPRFGQPPVQKITVGGNRVVVAHLAPILNTLEPGWGGPALGTILGSPRGGTALTLERVLDVVQSNC